MICKEFLENGGCDVAKNLLTVKINGSKVML
jgi:hypothetical protein